MRAAGAAADDARHHQPEAAPRAIRFDGLQGIFRACWKVTAVLSDEGFERIAVEVDGELEHPGSELRHHCQDRLKWPFLNLRGLDRSPGEFLPEVPFQYFRPNGPAPRFDARRDASRCDVVAASDPQYVETKSAKRADKFLTCQHR